MNGIKMHDVKETRNKWKERLKKKSSSCSYRWPRFSSWHPHRKTHNCSWLQLQGRLRSLAPRGTCAHVQKNTHMQIIENNKQREKWGWRDWEAMDWSILPLPKSQPYTKIHLRPSQLLTGPRVMWLPLEFCLNSSFQDQLPWNMLYRWDITQRGTHLPVYLSTPHPRFIRARRKTLPLFLMLLLLTLYIEGSGFYTKNVQRTIFLPTNYQREYLSPFWAHS